MKKNHEKNNLSEHIYTVLLSMGENVQSLKFCAEGEYNCNYYVRAATPYLFRINKSSQRNDPMQIVYEYRVLTLLAGSTYTPKPIAVFHPKLPSHPFKNTQDYEYAARHFPCGFMKIEYIDGASFTYESYKKAAQALAHIHKFSSQYTKDTPLDIQLDPISVLLDESRHYLLTNDRDYTHKSAGETLYKYLKKIRAESQPCYPQDTLCIVNTELNSGNLIQREKVFIVDWEKAIYSYPYQDLAHFLIPTTTLWKTKYQFSQKAEREFCEHYLAIFQITDIETLLRTINIFKKAVMLRALSWCYMAWHNNRTCPTPSNNMEVMTYYLDNLSLFLL